MVITAEHKEKENSGKESTKHLASTMQGCGVALAEKVLRRELTNKAEQETYIKQLADGVKLN
jgi:adenylosuccinate synthase